MEHSYYMQRLPGGHCFFCHQDYPDEHDFIECSKKHDNKSYFCDERCKDSKYYQSVQEKKYLWQNSQ